jgi:hypothetical protein
MMQVSEGGSRRQNRLARRRTASGSQRGRTSELGLSGALLRLSYWIGTETVVTRFPEAIDWISVAHGSPTAVTAGRLPVRGKAKERWRAA